MKNKFLLTLLAGTALLSSCVKDDNISDGVYGTEGVENIKIVEIHDGPDHVFSYDASSTDKDYEIFDIRLNAPAANDVNITLTADQSLIDDYNDDNGTSYAVIPSS